MLLPRASRLILTARGQRLTSLMGGTPKCEETPMSKIPLAILTCATVLLGAANVAQAAEKGKPLDDAQCKAAWTIAAEHVSFHQLAAQHATLSF